MKNLIWIVVAVIILGGIWYVSVKPKASEIGPIKIGFVGSLTGDLQSWGTESKNSVALAVSEINQSGGIKGRPIEVIYEDGKCESAATASAAQKLINVDKVQIIISYCSLETQTIAPIAEENKILNFAPAATSPEVTNAGDYTFRLAPSDELPAKQMAGLLSDKYTKVAIITETSAFSDGFRANLIKELNNLGKVNIVFDESFNPGLTDFRSMLVKMKQSDPEAVIVNANTPVAEGLIMKQMKDNSLNLPKYGLYWGSDPEFLKAAGVASEGFNYYNFVANETDPRVQDFLNKYKQAYGSEDPNPQFGLLSYDAPFVLREALNSVGNDATKLKNYLYTMKPYDTLSGKVSFDQNGDSLGINFKLFEVKDGVPVEVK